MGVIVVTVNDQLIVVVMVEQAPQIVRVERIIVVQEERIIAVQEELHVLVITEQTHVLVLVEPIVLVMLEQTHVIVLVDAQQTNKVNFKGAIKMEQYVLHVTHQCNMRCKYCYETDRDTTYTTEEILNTCDSILKCNDNYSVEFIGGEPLLEFDHIKTGYNYIKDNADNVDSFVISTNLTIINDEILDWLEERSDIRVSVSLDGNAYMNQMRVNIDNTGTYSKVIKNIKLAMDRLGSERVGVHMTMHPYNVGYLFDGVKDLYDQGVRHIGVGIIESTIDIGQEFVDRYIHEMNRLSKTILFGDVLIGLEISELEGLKPEDDERTYVYDDNGKIIFESYGRSGDDSITNGEVNSHQMDGPSTDMIKYIRRTVYNIHQTRRHRINHDTITIDNLKLISRPKIEMDKGRSIKDTLDWFDDNFPHDCDLYTTVTDDNLYSSSVVLKANKDIKFNGKGTTEDASVVSALAEVIERLSALQFPVPMYSFSKDTFKLLKMITYNDMEEYVGNDKIRLEHTKKLEHRLPERYVKAYSLLEEKLVGINLQLICLEQGSNSLASGNSYEEAITQASCEAFERFCLYYSAIEKVRLFPTINPVTIDNPIIQSHLKFFDDNNYSVYIKDVGFDIFPVMGVYFVNNNKPDTDKTKYSYICAGSFDSDICIIRCFTEKVQIGINNHGVSLSDTEPLADLADGGRTKYDLSTLEGGEIVTYVPSKSDNLLNDIYEIKTICYELGVDLYIVDFTKYGFPVVYVVIPEVSNMNRYYGSDNTSKILDQAGAFNFLLGDVR
jgi:YcaO-like protein with predicted kinase domain